MSDWSAAGLPAPLVNGFGQRTDRGLSRTPFASAFPEQAVIRTRARRSLSLSFILDGAQLASAEALLQAQGYQGFTLPLANLSDQEGACLVDTAVRLTADYQVSAIRPGLFQLTCEAETLLTPALAEELACDSLYAIQVYKINLYVVTMSNPG